MFLWKWPLLSEEKFTIQKAIAIDLREKAAHLAVAISGYDGSVPRKVLVAYGKFIEAVNEFYAAVESSKKKPK